MFPSICEIFYDKNYNLSTKGSISKRATFENKMGEFKTLKEKANKRKAGANGIG